MLYFFGTQYIFIIQVRLFFETKVFIEKLLQLV